MAVLTEQERFDVWAEYMRVFTGTGLLKDDLRAAVDDTDDWLDSNNAAYVLAVPEPARSVMTAKELLALQSAVVAKRFEVA